MLLGQESADITIKIDEEDVVFKNPPTIMNGRVMVALREIAGHLDMTVLWQDGTEYGAKAHVIIKKDDYEILSYVEGDAVYKGSQVFFLDQPPVLINGRLYVPIRFFQPILNCEMTWNNMVKTVIINTSRGISVEDKYYKLYNVSVGPEVAYPPEKARAFVLDNNLLEEIETIKVVELEPGSYDSCTRIIGYDDTGQRKTIYLTEHRYLKEAVIKEVL